MILTPGMKTNLPAAGTKKIMDLFEDERELYSFEVKKMAGFGKGGEKNFDGVITELQMQGYIVIRDFRSVGAKKTAWSTVGRLQCIQRRKSLMGL